jgi:hypothetical protein
MSDLTNAILRVPLHRLTEEQAQRALRYIKLAKGMRNLRKEDLKEVHLEDVEEMALEVTGLFDVDLIPYHVQWGAGDEYMSGALVFDGKVSYNVSLSVPDGNIVIPLDGKGEPVKNDILHAQAYLKLKKELGI